MVPAIEYFPRGQPVAETKELISMSAHLTLQATAFSAEHNISDAGTTEGLPALMQATLSEWLQQLFDNGAAAAIRA